MACRSGSARFIVWGKYHEGEIILAPMDVHFDLDNILQPDILYIRRDNLHIIRDGWVFGVPDLVVEILSENKGKRDKTIKKDTYERFGVGEYWLADPVYRIVDQFVLADGQIPDGRNMDGARCHCVAYDFVFVCAAWWHFPCGKLTWAKLIHRLHAVCF